MSLAVADCSIKFGEMTEIMQVKMQAKMRPVILENSQNIK